MKRFQGQGLIQHCDGKGNDYHVATAFYLQTLFGATKKRDAK
jgi:hypothetical protein